VGRTDITDFCRADGILQPCRTVLFTPEERSDMIAAIHVQQGDTVETNQLLLEFDADKLIARANLASNRIVTTQLRLDYLRARRAGSERIEAEKALMAAVQTQEEAENNLAVQQQMAAQGLASRRAAENAQVRKKTAEIDTRLARARLLELLEHPESPEIGELKLQLEELAIARRALEEQIARCRLVAPFPGRILELHEAARNLVREPGGGIRVRPGMTPLLVLGDTAKMRVYASLFERYVARIRKGQKVIIRAEHVPDRSFEGTVVHVGEMGRRHAQNATTAVEIIVENPDNLLKPGLTAELQIVISRRRNVLAVPVQYLRRQGGKAFVRRQAGRRDPEAVQVIPGVSDGNHVQIISGLDEGDVVVME
jgi:multidrug efflux pump subunit AcrA (membrane-fusion protein)